jgi:cell division protein FtsW (lipid II flippase)
VVSPFLVLFIHAGQLSPRSSLGVAVVWFALFAAMLVASSAGIRRAGMACLAASVLFFLFQDNRMFFSQHLVTQADTIMMARIAERIDQLAVRSDSTAPEVVFIGQYSHPRYEGMPRFVGDVLGYSQFEWDLSDEARWRIRGLARAIGVDHYVWRSASELGGTFQDPDLLQGRQAWPHSSSVFAHDGYAVVWLGKRREDDRAAPLQVWFDAVRAGRLGR